MSNRALTWAFAQDTKPGPGFVLVALADHADERHSCYPSYERIQKMTGIKPRTIATHMITLEDMGLIERVELRYTDGRKSGFRFFLAVEGHLPNRQVGLSNEQGTQAAEKCENGSHDHLPISAQPPADLRPATCRFASSHLPNRQHNNPKQLTPNTNRGASSSSKGNDGREKTFEDFITAYPPDTGGREGAAQTVFDRLNLEDRRAATEAANTLPRGFAEYPAVWLKSRGWMRPAPTVKAVPPLPTRPDDPDMARIYDCFQSNGKLAIWQNWLSPQQVSVVDGTIRPSTVFIQSQLRSQAKFRAPLKALGYTVGAVMDEVSA